jgi:hypothetical protein
MRTPLFIVSVLSILTLFTLGGCADLQGAIAKTSAWRDEASSIRDTLRGQIQAMQSEIETLEPGSVPAIELAAEIKLAHAKQSAIDAAIAQAELVLDEARQPSDSITTIARGVSSWVPAPIQGPLVLGAALIATLARSRQLKQSSASIVNSIAHVLERDDQFKTLFESHADTIRSIQTPIARKMVDQTQRKRLTHAITA